MYQSIIEVQARNLHQLFCASSCWDIRNISYSFHLKGDLPGCGDPHYELSYENSKTILDFHSRRYYVKTISYNEHSIHVIDIKFSDGSCILPSGSVKTAKEFSSDSHYKGRLSYTSFAHCSTELNQIAYRPVPCFPRYDSNFVYAIYEGYLLMPDLEPSCSLISVAPEDFVDVKFPSYEATGHENFAGRIPPWMVGRAQNTRWLRVLCYRFFPVFNKFCLEF